MKTIKSFFGIATAFFALLQISCTKENAAEEIIPEGYQKAVFKSIETKASLDGKTIKWDAKDYLAVYSFASGTKGDIDGNKFTKVGAEVTSVAEFTGVVAENADVVYVTYPYYINEKTAYEQEPVSPLKCNVPETGYHNVVTTIPGAQKLVADSIDPACNISACSATVAEENGVKVLSGEMHNLVSYLKFTIDGTKNISSVLVETRNNQRISGMSLIKFNSNGQPSLTSYESHYVTAYAEGAIAAGTYYLCVAPVDLTNDDATKAGFKITVSATDGKVYEYITRGVDMRRNNIYNLGTLEQLCVENISLRSVVFDYTSLDTERKSERREYSFNGYNGYYFGFAYYTKNATKYLIARNNGFLTTPVIDGMKLVKVNVAINSHTSNKAPVFSLQLDTGDATFGGENAVYATGEYRPVNSKRTGDNNATLKLYRQTVHMPVYFHQFVVGARGDLERNRTIASTLTEPYQLVNKSSTTTSETTSNVDRVEFIYEKTN